MIRFPSALHRELLLNNNQLRVLPFELGKLFQLQTLGLKGEWLFNVFVAILDWKSLHFIISFFYFSKDAATVEGELAVVATDVYVIIFFCY